MVDRLHLCDLLLGGLVRLRSPMLLFHRVLVADAGAAGEQKSELWSDDRSSSEPRPALDSLPPLLPKASLDPLDLATDYSVGPRLCDSHGMHTHLL